MIVAISVRSAKCLLAASGYLELGLARQALDELDRVSDFGPLSAPAHYLRGVALQSLSRFEEAAPSLTVAADALPEPLSRLIRLAASQCYRSAGRHDLAVQSLAQARGAKMTPGPAETAGE